MKRFALLSLISTLQFVALYAECNDVYLTKMQATAVCNNCWGGYKINCWQSNGCNSMPMGDGKRYAEYIVIHPPNYGVGFGQYALGGNYKRFTGIIGMANAGNHGCNDNTFNFKFEIKVDGVLKYQSEDFKLRSRTEFIDVDVTNAQTLRIETSSNGHYNCDQAVIAAPTLSCATSEWAAQANVGGWQLFEGAGKWYRCPEGYVVAGFWKNNCQSLYCLEEMRCVAPELPTVQQSCYTKNIAGAFDHAGTVECNAGYFVNGIWSNNNQNGQCGIYCWEYLNCCEFDTNRIIDSGKTETQNWWACFDGTTAGWCLVDNNEYITGFTRTAGNGQLSQLEEAKVRKVWKSASVVGVPETPQFEEKPNELNKPFGDLNYVEISKPVFLAILGLIAAVIVVNIIMMCCVKKNKGEVQGYGVVKQVDSDSEAV